jgi:glycyl-tRNA synthetase (class II)
MYSSERATVRDRDTMEQERVHFNKLFETLKAHQYL